MFSFKDLKEKKEIQKAKKEQKQNLEFILTDDSYMAQYLADKKKKRLTASIISTCLTRLISSCLTRG